jgi:hypothetical protein
LVVKLSDAFLHLVWSPLPQNLGRFIENVAQAQNGAPAEFAQRLEPCLEFAAGAEGMFVHENDGWSERLDGGEQQRGAQRADFLHRHAQAAGGIG